MALNYQSPAFVVVALLLFSAATPLAYGQLNALNVSGIFCCSPTGNCNNGALGLAGVPLALNCTTIFGTVKTVATGVTDSTGGFNLFGINLLSFLLSIVTGILPECLVVIKLPLNQTICPILNATNGVLVGLPTLLSTAKAPLLGLVGNASLPLFVKVTLGSN